MREYWIVDPKNHSVEVFLPDDTGRLTINGVYMRKDIVKVNVLPDCEINLPTVFPEDDEY